ncbi:hypothetical protein LT85_2326 [Collimonas arenae]|uniref:DUF6708 domain-containing protein n=1 Tax=Collimonas arenae TaxID=279058 RepID=A0A0A1FCS8_9BURK|nr:DUF6708 domain-containing protein [Collimonas arenae]AIY41484.1 hypothetical protein LT85_2326 [Collimonas arenae]
MYSGWWTPFSINRPLTQDDRAEVLPHSSRLDVEPNERSGLIRFNSTYIDWIDRRFFLRGMLKTFLLLVGWLILLCMFLFIVKGLIFPGDVERIGYLIPFPVAFLGVAAIYYAFLRFEFFSYVYYPIRFNRKTRMVHVFRHNGSGGVLSRPWDEIFFHLGHGTDPVSLRDIRGEILDGDMVTDTFALGHFFERPQPVLEMWEFIRRYMEEGPEAVGEHPLDRYVSLSVTDRFKNCLIMSRIFYGAETPFTQAISLPLVVLSAVTRWLIFKTCKVPVFPPEIEAECVVEANDPNVWPIPETSGQFAAENPAIMQRAVERAEKAASR